MKRNYRNIFVCSKEIKLVDRVFDRVFCFGGEGGVVVLVV